MIKDGIMAAGQMKSAFGVSSIELVFHQRAAKNRVGLHINRVVELDPGGGAALRAGNRIGVALRHDGYPKK